MRVSQLRIYSIGVVAANKPLDSNVIDVVAVEDSPMLDGEINATTEKDSVSSQDQSGAAYQVDLNSAVSIKAEWLPINSSNRKTSPDVRRGERVVLYQFADTDKYYWNTLFDDMRLRKLETVVYEFSATPNETDKDTPDTTYYFEVSTHKGLVHLHTSKKNGEPFGYDVQINTKDGYLRIQDDANNYFVLDSRERQLALHNGDGTYVELNKKDMTINVPETLTVLAKNIVEKVGQTVKSDVGDSVTLNTKDIVTSATTIDTVASSSIVEKGATVTHQASGLLDLKGGAAKLTGTTTVVITGGTVAIK